MNEKIKNQQKAWYLKNRSSVLAQTSKWQKANREKARGYTRKWALKNTEHLQNYELKKKYGITLEEQKTLLASQHHRCAICKTDTPKGRWNKWQVDHCHKSKQVRGMLCWRCNNLVGVIENNLQIMKPALSYIKKVKSI